MGNTSPLLDVDVVCSSTYVVGLSYQSLFVSVGIVVVEVIQASEESVIVKKHIRLCTFLSIFVLLVACGEQSVAIEQSATSEGETTGVTASATTNNTRIITHPLGETQFPSNPQRIVSLNPAITDSLIALDITPVGVATFTGSDFESYEYLSEELQDVAIVGTFAEPNQEAIVQLDPDLIIGRDEELTQTYATLSQIAPTVAVEDQPDFRLWLRQVAVIVGRETEAEEQIAAYEEQADVVGAAIREVVGDETVVFLRVQPDRIRLYSDQRLGGPILYNDLGITQPAFVEDIADDVPFVDLSLEDIPLLVETDHIFLLYQSEDGNPSPVFSNPLWESLPAVQNEQVYPATRDIWINPGFLASGQVLETIEQSLVEDTSSNTAVLSRM